VNHPGHGTLLVVFRSRRTEIEIPLRIAGGVFAKVGNIFGIFPTIPAGHIPVQNPKPRSIGRLVDDIFRSGGQLFEKFAHSSPAGCAKLV
jgi:hypothetical protein